jgi:hypothetical protein
MEAVVDKHKGADTVVKKAGSQAGLSLDKLMIMHE